MKWIIVLAVVISLSIWRPGAYESGDMQIHAIKTIVYTDLVKSGQILPVWADQLNAGFGYPLFGFTYLFPYFSTASFHLLGMSALNSVKLSLFLAFIISGATMYAWTHNKLASLLYLLFPYHIIDLHFRVAIGEVWSFVFLPMCLYFMRTDKKIHLSVAIAGLILSHPAFSLLSMPIIFIYYLYLKKYSLMVNLVFGLGLSAFYWLGVLWESQFTLQNALGLNIVLLTPGQILYSPWRFGLLLQGPHGELRTIIGYVFIIGLLYALYLKRKPQIIKLALLGSLVYLIMTQIFTRSLWDYLPLVKSIQFAYRLLGPASVLIALVCAWAFSHLRPKIVYFLIIMAVGTTVLNWRNRKMLPGFDDTVLRAKIPTLTYETEGYEATPRWIDPKHPWQKNIISSPKDYLIKIDSPSWIQQNTLYFPGWKLWINDKPTPIAIEEKSGIMKFFIAQPGNYKVRFKFELTPIRQFGLTISAVCLLVLGTQYLKSKPV